MNDNDIWPHLTVSILLKNDCCYTTMHLSGDWEFKEREVVMVSILYV